jgi:hypothetical protein
MRDAGRNVQSYTRILTYPFFSMNDHSMFGQVVNILFYPVI